MVDFNSTIPIISLSINKLDSSIKSEIFTMDAEARPASVCVMLNEKTKPGRSVKKHSIDLHHVTTMAKLWGRAD